MTEERITEHKDAEGVTHTHTTVITDGARSGGTGLMMFLILAVLIVAGIFAFTQFGGSEAVKDNAVAEAAQSVGTAADKVGNAAQDVADDVTRN